MLKAQKEGRSLTSDSPKVKPKETLENSGEDENLLRNFSLKVMTLWSS